jgi:hypothetical protein
MDKAFVPRSSRTLILCPDAFQALAFSLSQYQIYGSPAPVQDYEALKVHGFNVLQSGVIKDAPYNVATSTTLNSNGITNLLGIAAHKAALAIASRAPLEVSNDVVTAVNETDETSGFTMQNRVSYLQTTGQYQLSSTAIYGCAAGNLSGSLNIIV